ncbi:hypothetical protein MJO28_004541 [Puccinia striiformis f. sp. tritici]|uniref:Uncharacterized protein n=2 Tax=Puccinia striiformis f. sp. tritici TaxID=168172 RepID=A0A0L0VBH6_9BASI|nr:hypothetical protein Pst134EB_008017 [Puccinia striiformis f. sp. tritici]KAI7957446.1 hypothetical protein MJO28_004541 [Puccinia striiformis f. sp. tritici]KNE96349.1 hypothetical protein PSTG_10316 [Puccinia striiformis f. sp. tritici PST-78]KNE96350.1 hypothetical protein, variant [Puccinia striiformis f. sp. tritici PST-78]
MGVSLLPIWLLITSILGPIGESTCLTTYKDTFELARVDTEFLISQRKEAKEISGGPCTISEMEYAHKVTWKHPGTSDSKGKASVGTGADHAARILQQLKETVFSRLYNLMNPKFGDGFIKGTEEKYLRQLDLLILDLGNLHSGMEETTKDTHALDALRQKDPSSTAGSKNNFSKIFKDMHDIHTVLKSGMKLGQNDVNSRANETVYRLIFCLSDALTEYLSILEKHPWVNLQALTESLNEGDNWMVLFHYVMGKFTPTTGPAGVFLTYEFKKRIRLNGFTEEIHGLLNILNEENWRKVENLYLVMRIELQPLGKMLPNANIRPDPRDIDKWEKIKNLFFITAVSEGNPSSPDAYHHFVKSAITELALHITKNPASTEDNIPAISWQLTQLRLKVDLVHYFFQFLVNNHGSQIIRELKTEPFYPKLQGIDKSFKLLHDVLQVGEYKLAELIKLLNYESSLKSPEVKDVPTTLYLTGMNNIRAKSKLPSSVDSQINEAKGRQIIGLLESPTGSSSLEADNSEALIERNQEMKRISEFWDPQSKTSWMESLLNQPIANKLDHLTAETLIDHPAQAPETEKISQLLNGDLGPEFQIALPIIKQTRMIVKEFDLIRYSGESLLRKKSYLKNLVDNPIGLTAGSK